MRSLGDSLLKFILFALISFMSGFAHADVFELEGEAGVDSTTGFYTNQVSVVLYDFVDGQDGMFDGEIILNGRELSGSEKISVKYRGFENYRIFIPDESDPSNPQDYIDINRDFLVIVDDFYGIDLNLNNSIVASAQDHPNLDQSYPSLYFPQPVLLLEAARKARS